MKVNVGNTLTKAVGSTLVAIGTLSGCSGAPMDVGSSGPTGVAPGAGDPSAQDNAPAEIASVSVLDTNVIFYSVTLNGVTNIGMRESGSAFAKRTLVAPLLAQGLTTQEIYVALAPEGATVPPALVATQENEAAWMGRSAEVRHVTIDRSALVEKSAQSCDNLIITTTPPDGINYIWLNTPQSPEYVNNKCVYIGYPDGYPVCNKTTNWTINGACNESSSVPVGISVWEDYGSNCATEYEIGSVTAQPYTYYYWYWKNPGGAQYDVQGWNCPAGVQYDLVEGYEYLNLH